ncbi:MAG: ABC transporter ATP-binding protein [Gemmataceae bacterium]
MAKSHHSEQSWAGDADHHSQDHHHGHGPSPLIRLLRLLRPEARDLWLVVVFSFGIGLLSLAVPIAVEALVSNVQGGNNLMFQVVVVLALVLLAALSLAGAMRALTTFIVEIIQRRIFVRVVAELAHRLPRVKLSAFDRQHGPELVNRFFDVLTVQKAGATLLLDGVTIVIQALIGLLVLAIWHPYLLGFNLALLLSLGVMIFLLGIGAIRANIQESYAKYAVAGWLEEMVRFPVAFKFAAGQDYALQRADELTRDYLEARILSFRILFRQIIFGVGLQAIASAALFGLGGWLVIRNELTIGQLVAAELIVSVIVGSFVKLGKSLESYYDLMAGMDKLGHLVDLPLERKDGDSIPAPDHPAALALRNLSYTYDDGAIVLDQLQVSIKPGERVALLGPSGAGKTTLFDLIMGLREPTAGSIHFDGLDIRSLDLRDLRSQVASVSGSEVFDGTVLDNIRLGRLDVNIVDIHRALEVVDLLHTFESMPQGLNTRLVTGGSSLASGEANRLMLARAIASRPRLLLIDETLDQLDPVRRRPLLEALFNRQAGWTLLVATRDPEIITLCDRTLELVRPGASTLNGTHGYRH